MSAPTRPRTSRQENLALLLGGIGFAVGGVIALFVLRPQSPIFGRGSAGELGAFVAFFSAAVSFVVAMRIAGMESRPWLGRMSHLRRALDQFGLSVVHAAFSFYGTTAIYAVFSGAFRTLELDR